MKVQLVILALNAAASVNAAKDQRLFLPHRLMQAQVQTVVDEASPNLPVVEDDSASATEAPEAVSTLAAVVTTAAPPKQEKAANFPKLPTVDTMLGSASATLKALSEQSGELQKQITQTQADNKAKMARQKAAFEDKLRRQELANRELITENSQVKREIAQLEKDNEGIRQRAKALQDTNKVMRQELSALDSKLGMAKEFVATSLQKTDDSHSAELKVLYEKWEAPVLKKKEAATSKPKSQLAQQKVEAKVVTVAAKHANHAADSEDDDDDDDDDNATSFLALSREHRRLRRRGAPVDATSEAEQKARELIKVLQSGVQTLSEQEKASTAQLKQLFVANFKEGAQRYSSLAAEQMQLNATRTSLFALKSELETAEGHLKNTKSKLNSRLHEVGTYLQKLAHLALAPADAAPRLLSALPADVTSSVATTPTA